MIENFDNKAISDRITLLLRMKNMTKYKLSQATGVGESTISTYFVRNSKWSIDVLFAIAKYFNVSLDWIVKGEEKAVSYQLTAWRHCIYFCNLPQRDRYRMAGFEQNCKPVKHGCSNTAAGANFYHFNLSFFRIYAVLKRTCKTG